MNNSLKKNKRIGKRLQRDLLRLERQYYREIRQLFRSWILLLLKELSAWGYNLRFDGPFDALGTFFEGKKEAWGKEVRRFAFRITQTARKINELSKLAFTDQIDIGLDINPFLTEPWLDTELDAYTKENVNLITKIGQDSADRIQTLVTDAIKSGKSTSKLATEIKDVLKSSDNRAKLIARDQVGKFNGRLTQVRMEQAGISSYIWLTAGDSRVRKRHQELNNTKRKYGQEPEPGQEIACRCIAVIDPEDI